MLNKSFYKILSFTLVLLMNCVFTWSVYADNSEGLSYGAEYTEDSVKITLYIKQISAFDVALIYDTDKLKVENAAFTTEFKELQKGGKNTTISIFNPNAKDEAGNTYIVFTGAGTNNTSGDAIDFSGKPLAELTFKGDLSEGELNLILGSASVKNVKEAELIAKIPLTQPVGTVVTPDPAVCGEAVIDTDTSTQTADAQEGESQPEETELESSPSSNDQEDETDNLKTKIGKTDSTVLIIALAVVAFIGVLIGFIILRKKKNR